MKYLLLSFVGICILAASCKKHEGVESDSNTKTTFTDSVSDFLQRELSAETFQSLDFSSSIEMISHDKKIGLQCFIRDASPKSFLIIVSKGLGYEGTWVDMSALVGHDGLNNGKMTVRSLDRKIYQELQVADNEVISLVTNDPTKTNYLQSANDDVQNPANINNESPILPEIIIYHRLVNGGAMVSFSSMYWMTAGNTTYTNFYYNSSASSGGSTNSSAGKGYYNDNVFASPSFISPDRPIADIARELQCFTVDASSKYTISINVNQPNPRSRDIVSAFSDFPVGHTFFTLQQQNSAGSIITRNVGFYPRDQVKPGDKIDNGIFGDDSNTPFTVSLRFNVSAGEFQRLTNTIINQQTFDYDLDNFNCTNEVIETMSTIGIILPSTLSNSTLFDGNNPADLGEDIRNMDLNDFSSQNGNRQFIRTVSNFNDQRSPVRRGTCG